MQLIASVSTGFIYCVSVTGVTGARGTLSDEIAPMIAELRKHTDKPLSVGFGVSTPEQAAQVAQIADGVIVGSAIVDVIEENMNDEAKLLAAVKQFAYRFSRWCESIVLIVLCLNGAIIFYLLSPVGIIRLKPFQRRHKVFWRNDLYILIFS